jgi:hypothetical protein
VKNSAVVEGLESEIRELTLKLEERGGGGGGGGGGGEVGGGGGSREELDVMRLELDKVKREHKEEIEVMRLEFERMQREHEEELLQAESADKENSGDNGSAVEELEGKIRELTSSHEFELSQVRTLSPKP